jgi:hypothetical protein
VAEDFINGVAEKINNLETYIMHKPSSDKYPYRLSSQGINTIEDFLLLIYTQNGLNIKMDLTKNKGRCPVISFTKS